MLTFKIIALPVAQGTTCVDRALWPRGYPELGPRCEPAIGLRGPAHCRGLED